MELYAGILVWSPSPTKFRITCTPGTNDMIPAADLPGRSTMLWKNREIFFETKHTKKKNVLIEYPDTGITREIFL